ncbi:hypothetical protein VNO80_08004 [Phaseolus coccineus]|uniref:Uncharacterized protein n=1 Tax=Phaseolus coccineus TaxID=3886 RepID=A0AAN9NRK2_PHACN
MGVRNERGRRKGIRRGSVTASLFFCVRGTEWAVVIRYGMGLGKERVALCVNHFVGYLLLLCPYQHNHVLSL